jgi:chromosome partitioning protein
MTVIAVCNQKGGSGKTTIAINLASAFANDGLGVLLLDLDLQGSAVDWSSIRPAMASPFDVRGIDRPQLLRQARALRGEYDVVVIDCPPQYADTSSAAVRVADFVLVPVQPSPFDVWASDAITGLVRTRQEATGGAPLAACVISRAISNTSLQRSIGAALEGCGLPVLRAGTTQRVAYATTAARGMTVFDGRRTIARQEMEAIRDEVKEMIHGAQSEARPPAPRAQHRG